MVSWEPVARGADQAPPIRVAPEEQARKLVSKVDAEIPAGAPAQSPMRFVVVIGKDGHIVRETRIGGDIWLRAPATEALHQWVYQPTLVDGKPVAVVTEVRVQFKPPQ